jgi:pre-60S factor REI1
MKRRVAGLPPVSAIVFNQKVLDRKAETAVMASARGSVCEVCNKTYTTENAYRSHLNSKKHKENEIKALNKSRTLPEDVETVVTETEAPITAAPATQTEETAIEPPAPTTESTAPGVSSSVDPDADEDEVMQTIDQKIAAARSRLSPQDCLFCSSRSSDIPSNLSHMSSAHSFFIPDAEYLVDLPGLLTYLGEKLAVGNTCVYCDAEFRTLDAVRKHMIDKAHCKLAYEDEPARLEVSDFYDFEASYPDAVARKARREAREARRAERAAAKAAKKEQEDQGAEWEEVDDDGSADEVVEESASEPSDSETEDDSETDSDDLLDNQITYGDSHMELVLPSGARIGHRNMRRYYAQSLHPRSGKPEDPNSGAALVRQLLADKNSALVPRRGGFGAFGSGTEVVKARNRGEAREAGRHVREFRDIARKEAYKTRVGYANNHQKHYRDPLLQ